MGTTMLAMSLEINKRTIPTLVRWHQLGDEVQIISPWSTIMCLRTRYELLFSKFKKITFPFSCTIPYRQSTFPITSRVHAKLSLKSVNTGVYGDSVKSFFMQQLYKSRNSTSNYASDILQCMQSAIVLIFSSLTQFRFFFVTSPKINYYVETRPSVSIMHENYRHRQTSWHDMLLCQAGRCNFG